MYLLEIFTTMLLTYVALVDARIFTLRVAHQRRGILTLSFNSSAPRDRSIQLLTTTKAGYQPGWLHSRGEYLYSVSRTHFPYNYSTSGGIFAFKKLSEGRLDLSDAVPSYGASGVYLDISTNGRTLSAANIDGSTVSVFPLISPGHFGRLADIFHYNLTKPGPGAGDSQEIANPHAVVFSPCGSIMAVPDRGADRVYLYQVHSTKHVEQIQILTLPPGTGPRHLLFSKVNGDKTLMFLIGELDNTVNVFSVEFGSAGHNRKYPNLNKTLRVTHLQRASTLDASNKRTKPMNIDLSSELAITNDGRFLYTSNRNTESVDKPDTIAIFSLDTDARTPLRFLGLNSTHGKIPRHFSLSSDLHNQFVAVANQVTNDLFIFKRHLRTGLLNNVAGNYSFGGLDITTKIGPMAVIWD
ncbi:hypothetical protein FLONG3_404 [Fusarium longipes]|uniref:6-phosphogluconolactonase n=1 Tax=Fusarium longipes TaxID=694270 RepID=A0A395TAG5_9HYPO|nr:hypothetical protein FLONG3_404 [Fusarium longipes]